MNHPRNVSEFPIPSFSSPPCNYSARPTRISKLPHIIKSSLGSRVRVSVTPCGFCGGRNEFWVGFSRDFFSFLLPQISFHHFTMLVSFISFHIICPCDGASGVPTGIIAIHRPTIKRSDPISSLDPALCRKRAEDIYNKAV